MDKIKPFMIYPTGDELKTLKEAAELERRSISSFVIKSALTEAELIKKEAKENDKEFKL